MSIEQSFIDQAGFNSRRLVESFANSKGKNKYFLVSVSFNDPEDPLVDKEAHGRVDVLVGKHGTNDTAWLAFYPKTWDFGFVTNTINETTHKRETKEVLKSIEELRRSVYGRLKNKK